MQKTWVRSLVQEDPHAAGGGRKSQTEGRKGEKQAEKEGTLKVHKNMIIYLSQTPKCK